MKKFRLLLLDANIVIELFRRRLWDAFLRQCDVHLAETVKNEAVFWEDENGEKHPINLDDYQTSGAITVFSVPPSAIQSFRGRFGPVHADQMEDGETESLAYLIANRDRDYLISSADAIVYRVLGLYRMGERGISLEEILGQIGMKRQLDWPFGKSFRDLNTRKGFAESL